MAKQGLPLPSLSVILAIIIELGEGILLLVGYETRLVAIGLAIYVAVAALIVRREAVFLFATARSLFSTSACSCTSISRIASWLANPNGSLRN